MSAKIIHSGPVDFSIYRPMICGPHDAQNRKYRLITPENGPRWVVAVQGNPADNIYKDGGKGSEGFGGSTLTFELEDGSTVDFTGPWATGADELFKATGYDVRDQYLTHGIVGLRREYGPETKRVRASYDQFYDVLHMDEGWVLGEFNRIEDIAYNFAKELGVTVWFSVISKGGGRASWVDKAAIERREKTHASAPSPSDKKG